MTFSDHRTLSEALIEHVRQHAASYYRELAGQQIRVRAGQVKRRQFADLCQLELKAPGFVRLIIAKATLPAPAAGGNVSAAGVSSRFLATADPPRSEFNALSAFAEHLAAVADPRWFSVRVLDCIFQDRVLLLERADARPLSQLLLSSSRLGGGRNVAGLLETLHRTGACLRAFQGMPPGARRQQRGTSKQEFLSWVSATEERVADHHFSREYFRAAVPQLLALAQRVLPDELPAGPVHDDFAPRNVLVNSQGQVGIIDMLDEWTGCVWEDIGHFLFSLGANKPQALTAGRFFSPAVIEKFREALLAGYFGREPIPRVELLLFESQIILSTWAAQWQRLAAASPWRATAKRLKLNASLRWYAHLVSGYLSQASSQRVASPLEQRPSVSLVAGETA